MDDFSTQREMSIEARETDHKIDRGTDGLPCCAFELTSAHANVPNFFCQHDFLTEDVRAGVDAMPGMLSRVDGHGQLIIANTAHREGEADRVL